MAGKAEIPAAGVAVEVADGIRRVLAPNPGPMTFWGTNSYIVGTREVVVIDPGPNDAGHRDALRRAIGGARVRAVVVTHAHRDHSTGARQLAADVAAPVLAFGPSEAGRSTRMIGLAGEAGLGGGEGVDSDFLPDGLLADGDTLDFGDGRLQALHTPGHFGGHIALALGEIVFTGDLVMGWSTTVISPPDGDVRDFLASCERLTMRRDRLFLPGHGAPIEDPRARLDWLIGHRLQREREILDHLSEGPATANALARRIYSDIPETHLPVAARNVLAHLVDLAERNEVAASPDIAADADWRLL